MNNFDNKFVWVMKNVSSLKSEEKCYSAPFQIHGIKWRLCAYVKKRKFKFEDALSLFLEVTDFQSMPFGWRQYVQSRLTIVNQISDQNSASRVVRKWFEKEHPSWGYVDMIPLSYFDTESRGFIVNGELMITVELVPFAPIGILDGSQDIRDESEWTTINYSSPPEEEDVEDVYVQVNGFRVPHSQVAQVKEIFEKHPDFAWNVNLKSQYLKDTYVDYILHVIETLSKSPKELTHKKLNKVDNALSDLTQAGFKVDWLRQQLEEKQRACGTSNALDKLRGFCRDLFN